MRIAVASFAHETCTFCPEPTTLAHLEPYAVRGEEMFRRHRGIPTYINGFLECSQTEPELELIPILAAGAAPGGFTSWLTRETFERYAQEIAQGLERARPLDGVLLALHGAMAVTGIPKPEAELVRRVRSIVGAAPIAVTLDLHANEDHELTAAADAVFVIKTYPHIDCQETGMAAAQCLLETIRGRVQPVQAVRRPGIVSASIFQASDVYPMQTILARCLAWEKQPGVLRVNAAPGYAYADVVDIGMSIMVVTDSQPVLAEQIAEDVASLAWSLKEAFNRPLPNTTDGVRQVLTLTAAGRGPIVIADGADRTGDSTHVLRELLAQGAERFVMAGLADPQVARDLESSAEVGDTVTVTVGGWASEQAGDPLTITGTIEYMGCPSYSLIGPMGRGRQVHDGFTIALHLGSRRYVVISEHMRSANDSSALTAVGIDYRQLDIIVLKDRVHHRAYWDDVAAIDFPIDAPGIGPANLDKLRYYNVPVDTYPIGAAWQSGCRRNDDHL